MSRPLAFVLAFAALHCDRQQSPETTTTPSSVSAPSASASVRKVIPGGCIEKSRAVWDAARMAPKACKSSAECELAGPAECTLKVRGEKVLRACMAAVAKGRGSTVNTASDAWSAAGCDKGLLIPIKEEAVCSAGKCSVVR